MLTVVSIHIAFTMWELMDVRHCQRLAGDYSFEHAFEGDQVGKITSEPSQQGRALGVGRHVDELLRAAGEPVAERVGAVTVGDIERAARVLGVTASSLLEGY